jgi:uncharacterized membrane protein YdjX (TVP38/TMEM64 family)
VSILEHKKIDVKKSIIKLILSLIIIGGIVLILYVVMDCLGLTNLTQQQLQDKISSFGALGPIIFIIVSFLQVTFVPIPGSITILCGNYLFGPWLSYLYSFIGMMLGSMLAFHLGRWFGKKFIYWLVSDKELVDKYLYKIKNKGNVLLFFMFIFPFFPDDLLCSVAGVLPISSFSFFIMQVVTRGVTILTTLFMLSGDIIPFTGWGIPFNICLTLILMLIFYICFKNAELISFKFSEIINKFKRKKKK